MTSKHGHSSRYRPDLLYRAAVTLHRPTLAPFLKVGACRARAKGWCSGRRRPCIERSASGPGPWALELLATRMGSGGDCLASSKSHTLAKGTHVTEAIARTVIKMKARVHATGSYHQRMGSQADVVFGRCGVVIGMHADAEGGRADVIWDNGKVFKGYCLGYRGYFDLELAADTTVPLDYHSSGASSASSSNSSPLSTTDNTPLPSGCSTPMEGTTPRVHTSLNSPTTGQTAQAAQHQWAPTAAAAQSPASRSPATTLAAQWCPQSATPAATQMQVPAKDSRNFAQKLNMAGKTAEAAHVLDINVGYLHKAPSVTPGGAKPIWDDNTAPLFAK